MNQLIVVIGKIVEYVVDITESMLEILGDG